MRLFIPQNLNNRLPVPWQLAFDCARELRTFYNELTAFRRWPFVFLPSCNILMAT